MNIVLYHDWRIKWIHKEEIKTNNRILLEFSINDTGIAISEKNKMHIFISFEQGDTNTRVLST